MPRRNRVRPLRSTLKCSAAKSAIQEAGALDSSPRGRGGVLGAFGAAGLIVGASTPLIREGGWSGSDWCLRMRLDVRCGRMLGPAALLVTEHRRDIVRVVLGRPTHWLRRALVVLGQFVNQVVQPGHGVEGGGRDMSMTQNRLHFDQR
jgi:hypothetical protein